MKAMILAGGLGTRLKPLTDRIPKALVEINGKPMLQRVIETLRSQGFDYIVVNVHHFASQIIEYLKRHDFGIKIEISDESEELLDTGGGLVKAFPLLFSKDDSPVLVHNVDILSNADLRELVLRDEDNPNLLVSDRSSSRKLLFNRYMDLVGWHDVRNGIFRPEDIQTPYNNEDLQEYAFSGIYTMTKSSMEEMRQLMGNGKFPVMEYFLNPRRHCLIKGDLKRELKILDIGKPETLSMAEKFL